MRLWRVRGQQWDTPALCHVWLPPSSLLLSPGEHAGPSDRQGAGVAVQTQGSGKIWRCVHLQYKPFVHVTTHYAAFIVTDCMTRPHTVICKIKLNLMGKAQCEEQVHRIHESCECLQ